MIEGTIKKTIGGREYAFAPLNFAGIKWFMASVENLSSKSVNEALDFISEAALRSLRRNNPEFKAEYLEEVLDAVTGGHVLSAVMEASGLAPKGLQPGEAMPGN